MSTIKSLTSAFAVFLCSQALALPNLQVRELAEIDFYEDCDGLVQTPYQASHPGTVNDVGVCVNETFNGLVVEWTASVTCEVFVFDQPSCAGDPTGAFPYQPVGSGPAVCDTTIGAQSWSVLCNDS